MGIELTPAEGYTFPTIIWPGTGVEYVANEQISFTINGETVTCGEFTVGVARCYLEFTTSQAEGFENVNDDAKSTKFMRDGVLYIERNGRIYNAQGQSVQ